MSFDTLIPFFDTVDYEQFTGLFVMFGIFAVIFLIVDAIATGLIFQKAGKPFWHAFIPFLNSYDLFDISTGVGWAFLAAIIPSLIGTICGHMELDALSLVFRLISFVPSIWCTVRLGKAFGKETGFILGMIFLPIIFELILGIGDSEYYGANGDVDPYEDLQPEYTPNRSKREEVAFEGTPEEAEAIAASMAAAIINHKDAQDMPDADGTPSDSARED